MPTATTCNLTLVLQKSSDGTVITGADVDLVPSYPSGIANATWAFTQNGDGSYTLNMADHQSCIGTIKVNGTAQSELTDVVFLANDILEHIGVASHGADPDFTTVHGLGSGDGNIVGTTKTQTLQNKTVDNTNAINAGAITSGMIPSTDRLPGSIPDSKLAQLTTPDKVAGEAVELAATNPGLELDGGATGGLQIKASDGVELTGNGLKVDLAASSGLAVSNSGLTIDAAGAGGLNLTASGIEVYLTDNSGLATDADGLAIDCVTGGGLEAVAGGLQIDIDQAADVLSLWAADGEDPPWGDPHNFTDGSTIVQAILGIDAAMNEVNSNLSDLQATADKRALCFYAQSVYDYSAGSDVGSMTGSANMFVEDSTTYKRKMFCPVNISPAINHLLVRFMVRQVWAGYGGIRFRLLDEQGQEIITDKEFIGFAHGWTVYSWSKSLVNEGASIWWVEMSMKTDDPTHPVYVIGLTISAANSSWIDFEETDSYWLTAAQDA